MLTRMNEPQFDSQRVRELMDEFADLVAGRPAETLAPWLVYLLERLDAAVDDEVLEPALLELQRAVTVRLDEGVW